MNPNVVPNLESYHLRNLQIVSNVSQMGVVIGVADRLLAEIPRTLLINSFDRTSRMNDGKAGLDPNLSRCWDHVVLGCAETSHADGCWNTTSGRRRKGV